MIDITKILKTIGTVSDKITNDENIKKILENEGIKGMLFGNYTDGTVRNLTDAIQGEYLSPNQKKKYNKKKKKINKFKF